MSDDEITVQQIESLTIKDGPLIILDVDEVLLQFLDPLIEFCKSEGYSFDARSFRISGNVLDPLTNLPVSNEIVKQLIHVFFQQQKIWQAAVPGALQATQKLSQLAQIVMLTAMPHEFYHARRKLLSELGFTFPLLTTNAAKGPAIASLMSKTSGTLIFIDDLPSNLISAHQSCPQCNLIHLMASNTMKPHLPDLAQFIHSANDWGHAQLIIEKILASDCLQKFDGE